MFKNKYIFRIAASLFVVLIIASLFAVALIIKKSDSLIDQLTLLQIENTSLIKQISEHQSNFGKNTATDVTNEYAIKKIDEISDMILHREAVPGSYFYFLQGDEELLADVKTYNETTALLVEYFTLNALDIVSMMCGLTDDDGNNLYQTSLDYTRLPVETHELVDKITRYALQENSTYLIMADPSLEQIRVGELGGSYGMWPNWIGQRIGMDENTKDEYLKYQELTKEILGKIEKYKIR